MPSALIIAEYGTLNGGEKSLLAILPNLLQAGWHMRAAVPEAGPFAEWLANIAVDVSPFEFVAHGKRKPLEDLRNELGQLIQQLAPDLVHCNSLSASRICGPVCQQAAVPSVGYLRDIIKLNQRVIGDLNRLDKIVAVSQATADFHVAQGIDKHRVQVIYNGVDSEEFTPGISSTDIRDESGIDSTAPLVLFVGQIGLRKGLDTWLMAAETIAGVSPVVHFLIVGARHSKKQESIDHEQALLDHSRQSTLQGRVHWLGLRTDVSDLMKQSTVLLHCARQEPLGRVLLESCASGLPIVATDVGGTAEILCDPSLDGLRVPIDRSDLAADAVLRLLREQEFWDDVSQTVRQIALKRFSVAGCANALLAVYSAVLNRS